MNQPDLLRRSLAELLGTFALVMAGCGAIVVNAMTGQLGHVGVALTFGFVVVVMVAATGHLSGAHLNPAVTLAFAVSRHFPWRETPAYIGGQLAGADGRRCHAAGALWRRGRTGVDGAEWAAAAVTGAGNVAHSCLDVCHHGRSHRYPRCRRTGIACHRLYQWVRRPVATPAPALPPDENPDRGAGTQLPFDKFAA